MTSDDDCNICFEKIPSDDNNGKGRGCPASTLPKVARSS